MKKIFIVLLCLIISVALFAQTDVRSYGLGGNHVTDYSDIYTIQKNPASLGFAGKHNLYTNFQFDISGPLNEYYDIANTLISEENVSEDVTVNLTEKISELITKHNGINTNGKFVGPINFGFTKNGFGLLFSEDIYVEADIPSVTMGKLNLGLEAALTLAYGYKIDLGINEIAIGVSAKGFAKGVNIGVDGSLSYILSTVNNLSNELPITTSLGYSVSVGAQYRFANFLNIGVVWNDVFAPTYTIDTPFIDGSNDFSMKDASKVIKPSTVSVGVGINIPTGFTLGIISSWTAYLDHENIMMFFDETNLRNPVLGFSAGTEIVLFKTIALRVGINESYLSAGCGLKFGAFHIDAALFGSELGLEPGSKPNLNAALSISFHK